MDYGSVSVNVSPKMAGPKCVTCFERMTSEIQTIIGRLISMESRAEGIHSRLFGPREMKPPMVGAERRPGVNGVLGDLESIFLILDSLESTIRGLEEFA